MKYGATLEEVRNDPTRLVSIGVSTLAFLMHEAEDDDDDVTFLRVVNEAESRGKTGESIVYREYKRMMSERAAGTKKTP